MVKISKYHKFLSMFDNSKYHHLAKFSIMID